MPAAGSIQPGWWQWGVRRLAGHRDEFAHGSGPWLAEVLRVLVAFLPHAWQGGDLPWNGCSVLNNGLQGGVF